MNVDTAPEIAVVVPAHNEAENVGPLIDEIATALKGRSFEMVFVNDGSTDATAKALAVSGTRHPELRVVRHKRACGQSTAIVSGVRAARAGIIVTMDGDGQNDPADAPALIDTYKDNGGGDFLLIAGHRVNRRDTWLKRVSSKVANGVRGGLLRDATPDTGCGLKVFSRQAFLHMPAFNHMHRFLPALMIRAGGQVQSVPVNHRPRMLGVSKYGLWNRLWVGIVDIFGVIWLIRRAANPELDESSNSEGKRS
ncbi:MAG: glycosyltransferase family 2 protein [Rhodospirillaceae bacterium]|nr:glycosyltransferase family 2 protein [Rhodospirillaceae bacterium]